MSEISKHLMGESEPIMSVSALKYEPELMDVICKLFLEHGGTIEDFDETSFLARFPSGTTRVELYPRLHSMRYEITFPDGFAIQEVVTRDGLECLQFPISSFSQELQQRYSH
jgi:hypothetical protein